MLHNMKTCEIGIFTPWSPVLFSHVFSRRRSEPSRLLLSNVSRVLLLYVSQSVSATFTSAHLTFFNITQPKRQIPIPFVCKIQNLMKINRKRKEWKYNIAFHKRQFLKWFYDNINIKQDSSYSAHNLQDETVSSHRKCFMVLWWALSLSC